MQLPQYNCTRVQPIQLAVQLQKNTTNTRVQHITDTTGRVQHTSDSLKVRETKIIDDQQQFSFLPVALLCW